MVNGGVVQAAFLAGSIAAGATVVGTLPALFARSPCFWCPPVRQTIHCGVAEAIEGVAEDVTP